MAECESQSPDLQPVRGLFCPRCSSRVGQLPLNGVSPVPAYKCLGCGITLTTGSGRLLHIVAVVLAVGSVGAGVYNMIQDNANVGSAWKLVVAGVVVFGYCTRTVFQPAVRRGDLMGE